MARGTILTTKCSFCGKIAKEKNRFKLGEDLYLDLECGHTVISEALNPDEQLWQDQLVEWGAKGLVPYPFQIEGVKFLENCDCNGLLLDEQGLGKTIQTCMLLKRNPNLFPALIVVKSGLRAQWFKEIFKWTGEAAQVITSSREVPYFDLFNVVIVSIDSLRLLRADVRPEPTELEKEVLKAQGKRVRDAKIVWTDEICAKFNFIVIDESQKIKTSTASRTQALRLVAQAGIKVNGKKPRVLPMSGTNVEKHAGEFYNTLNLVNPELFPNRERFIRQHVQVRDGKLGGLKYPEQFRNMTKDFIIRRKRVDVLPELPKVFRQFRLAELEVDELTAYIKVMKEFLKAADDIERPMMPNDLLGYMSRLRHCTGIAKVNAAVEFVEEFMLETELERKLAIFLHHQIAGEALMAKIEELCKMGGYAPPLYYHAGLDPLKERPAMEEKFRQPGNKIMVLSTQAAAEGLNLQFCSDCLIMERQWNPSTEEQAESRFTRPGSTADRVNAHYLIAAGTIDDFFTELVEIKRRNVTQTLDGVDIEWDETSLIAELGRVALSKGLRRWKL
jgi:SNF2 family DNA or RNA helicase